jgi:hypothetical protein
MVKRVDLETEYVLYQYFIKISKEIPFYFPVGYDTWRRLIMLGKSHYKVKDKPAVFIVKLVNRTPEVVRQNVNFLFKFCKHFTACVLSDDGDSPVTYGGLTRNSLFTRWRT